MIVSIYNDDTISINIESITKILNSCMRSINFIHKDEIIKINSKTVSKKTCRSLEINKTNESDLRVVFTEKQYDNNYYFQSDSNTIIVSFYLWKHLTTLPHNNGALYFISSLLSSEIIPGTKHMTRTGCIRDFLMEKTDVDVGMRSAYICPDCQSLLRNNKQENDYQKNILTTEELMCILNKLSYASRSETDVATIVNDAYKTAERDLLQTDNEKFDVFMCHNNKDKNNIKAISNKLKQNGLNPWLDIEQILPGEIWQDKIENIIPNINSAAIFVGKNGIGPWHNQEIRAILSEFANSNKRLIPVILPDCSKPPILPLFLRQMHYVDMRDLEPDPIELLTRGIVASSEI
ncbi:MAG: toll/interleukin-1 receptor domain-containing protein [Magnetococcales bacterium]|nr:toll/interleukin-1 receptor domain-containing protein [Magnetococcales bacterium]